MDSQAFAIAAAIVGFIVTIVCSGHWKERRYLYCFPFAYSLVLTQLGTALGIWDFLIYDLPSFLKVLISSFILGLVICFPALVAILFQKSKGPNSIPE
jgi:hypothetical protein